MIYLRIYLYTIYYDIYTGPEQASYSCFFIQATIKAFFLRWSEIMLSKTTVGLF